MTRLRSVPVVADDSGELSNEQLTLFAVAEVPERFRLDDATRRRGMRHVAELKAMLEAKYPSSRSGRRRSEPRVPLGARSTRSAA